MTEKQTVNPDLGYEINGPGRQYFDNVVTDNMMDALVEISAALWTVRDRQIVLEKKLIDKGIEAEALIEAHIPDEAEKAMRAAEREEMVQRIFRSFMRNPNSDTTKDADVLSLREITD